MRAQTAASDVQLANLMAAIPAMDAPGNTGAATGPVAPLGGRRATADIAPRGKHVCKNCKRLVCYKYGKCMELPANAAIRYEGWVSCLASPIT